jgi:hypothetical protein
MAYIGNQSSNSFSSMIKQDLTGVTGNPVKRGFALDHAVANSNEIEVFVNNVRQEPGDAYNASGAVLTMTGDVETTDSFYIIYIGKALQTTVPPANSITAAMMTGAAGVGSFLGDTGTALGNIIRVHEKELNSSVTVAGTTNGVAAGPLTVASGVVLTIANGATLAVV